MMLDLAGGKMNAGPSWALSVKELKELGLTENQAKHHAGVPPTFALDGRWVLLVDDEPFDASHSRVIEICGDQAICSRGPRGTVIRTPKKTMVRFERPGAAECITISSAQSDDFLSGMAYLASELPEGDPGASFGYEADDADGEQPLAMVAWLYRQGTTEEILTRLEARIAAMDPSEEAGE